jgi:hypothetical protein
MKGSSWKDVSRELPRPSPHFREQAWREFQHLLDPLSPRIKPLPPRWRDREDQAAVPRR